MEIERGHRECEVCLNFWKFSQVTDPLTEDGMPMPPQKKESKIRRRKLKLKGNWTILRIASSTHHCQTNPAMFRYFCPHPCASAADGNNWTKKGSLLTHREQTQNPIIGSEKSLMGRNHSFSSPFPLSLHRCHPLQRYWVYLHHRTLFLSLASNPSFPTWTFCTNDPILFFLIIYDWDRC